MMIAVLLYCTTSSAVSSFIVYDITTVSSAYVCMLLLQSCTFRLFVDGLSRGLVLINYDRYCTRFHSVVERFAQRGGPQRVCHS